VFVLLADKKRLLCFKLGCGWIMKMAWVSKWCVVKTRGTEEILVVDSSDRCLDVLRLASVSCLHAEPRNGLLVTRLT
jgi:hypothetical protein